MSYFINQSELTTGRMTCQRRSGGQSHLFSSGAWLEQHLEVSVFILRIDGAWNYIGRFSRLFEGLSLKIWREFDNRWLEEYFWSSIEDKASRATIYEHAFSIRMSFIITFRAVILFIFNVESTAFLSTLVPRYSLLWTFLNNMVNSKVWMRIRISVQHLTWVSTSSSFPVTHPISSLDNVRGDQFTFDSNYLISRKIFVFYSSLS